MFTYFTKDHGEKRRLQDGGEEGSSRKRQRIDAGRPDEEGHGVVDVESRVRVKKQKDLPKIADWRSQEVDLYLILFRHPSTANYFKESWFAHQVRSFLQEFSTLTN